MRITLGYGGRVLFSGDPGREHVSVLAVLESVKKRTQTFMKPGAMLVERRYRHTIPSLFLVWLPPIF